MQHSKVVGGSTAKRVINCPGSVALVQKMPPQVASKYAEEGTMLHACMEDLLADPDSQPAAFRRLVEKHNLTEEQQAKLDFCTKALDEIDPHNEMTFVQEVQVEFEGVRELEGVFGNVDLIGRMGDRMIVLDWKFGDGVIVEAEENYQGLFYAAAAAKTTGLYWAGNGTREVEIVIVQPPQVRRWVTTWKRVNEFTKELIAAVRAAARADAPLAIGDWCRWCTAKPICPQMNGSIDRVVHTALKDIDGDTLGQVLARADALESFISDARALAHARLEKGMPVPGYKLVAKRAVRQWADEKAMHLTWLNAGLDPTVYLETKLRTPAQMEKVCKEHGVPFPANQVVSVSSGNTLAAESDPRPAAMVLGEQLRAALNRVQ